MAVVSVNEHYEQRRSAHRDAGVEHTRVWLVETDSPADGTAAALTADDGATAVPAYGNSHPTDPRATARDISAEVYEDSQTDFLVSVRYREPDSSGGGTGFDPNPINRAAVIQWRGSSGTEAYFQDVNDKPVVNSANQPFDELLVRETGEMEVFIQVNQSGFDASQALSYRHVVNSDAVTIDGWSFSAGQCKMGAISADKHVENGITYYQVRYPIKLRGNGFEHQPLDVGYEELVNGERKKILDADGEPVSKPAPLNSDGTKAAAGSTPTTLTFQPYEAKPFGVFDFS